MKENEFDQDLDRMMNDKLNEKQFEFKESYWADAKELIAQDRRRRSGRFIIPTIVFLSVVGISMALIVTSPKQKTTRARGNTIPAAVTEQASHVQTVRSDESVANPTRITPPVKHLDDALIGQEPSLISALSPEKVPTSPEVIKNAVRGKSASTQHLNIAEQDKKMPVITESQSPMATPSFTLTERKTVISAQTANAQPLNDEGTSDAVVTKPPINLALIDPLSYRPSHVEVTLCDTCLNKKLIYPEYAARKAANKKFLVPELGLTFYNPSSSFYENIDLNAGLRYHHFISKRIDVNIGLFYSRLHQHLDDLKYEKIKYSFGKQVDRTTIRTLRLDYIEMPVHVAVCVHKDHFVTTGATFGYLLNSHNAVIKQGNENKSSTTFEDGYMYAVNKYDVQLDIGYMVFLPNNVIVSANYGFGLQDISGNQVFHSAAIDRNTGIRLNIAYKLSK